ncbi:hypothetical protein BLNAU_23450 [Blattamonas nauphoetae]|uniref:Right handed beta helix domain-containing protein n=1 Tax=Blattamonas nauphoetae TaxID=2049346 RepID=A0ABQ9WQN3_9EUKA|nr:hypothetical protein BLNAU_23450 [Blattamonas nauphoetae]
MEASFRRKNGFDSSSPTLTYFALSHVTNWTLPSDPIHRRMPLIHSHPTPHRSKRVFKRVSVEPGGFEATRVGELITVPETNFTLCTSHYSAGGMQVEYITTVAMSDCRFHNISTSSIPSPSKEVPVRQTTLVCGNSFSFVSNGLYGTIIRDINADGDFLASNLTVSSNHAHNEAGYTDSQRKVYSSSVTVRDCFFNGCMEAQSLGGLYFQGNGKFEVIHCKFVDCHATSSGSHGGAFAYHTDSTTEASTLNVSLIQQSFDHDEWRLAPKFEGEFDPRTLFHTPSPSLTTVSQPTVSANSQNQWKWVEGRKITLNRDEVIAEGFCWLPPTKYSSHRDLIPRTGSAFEVTIVLEAGE